MPWNLNNMQIVPESFQHLQSELNAAQHLDIKAEAAKAASFEEAIGTIAAKLNVVLDGDYDPDDLFTMLVRAMRNRNSDRTAPPSNVDGLMHVTLTETSGSIHMLPLQDEDIIAESARHNKQRYNRETGTNELPPYTVCNVCENWGECCEHRTCEKGAPALQLGWALLDAKQNIVLDS